MGIAKETAAGWVEWVEWVGDAVGRLLGAGFVRKVRQLLPDLWPGLPDGPALLDFRVAGEVPEGGAGSGAGLSGAGLFRDMRFSESAVRYIMDEALWGEFETFYRVPQSLSWWLLTGQAGVGKSRAAFEFCRTLVSGRAVFFRDGKFDTVDIEPVVGENYSSWRAGFLDLAETPFSFWDGWRPRSHTLLVLDNVSCNYNARLGDIEEGENQEHNRYNIVEIVKLLAQKAAKGQFGPFRVRLLLLEREYRAADGEGAPLDWYADLPKYLSLQYKAPTPMPPVSGAGLIRIAHDMQECLRQRDPEMPYTVPRDFLTRLAAIDAGRRPLFAMLLAAYMATDSDPEVTRREVFENALWNEVEQVLKPAEVERTPLALKALVMATLTGGRVGACKLDDMHPLWRSGLGCAAASDEEMFRLYPAEPGLLGEYFVLTGIGQDDIFGSMCLSDEEMQAMILKAWEVCPQEAADFFERCGQDFTADSAWIGTRLLIPDLNGAGDAAKQRFMNTAANLLGRFGKLEVEAAHRLFEFMENVGMREEFQHARARATASMVRICCEAGLLEEASSVFLSLRTLKETPENRLCLAEAVACLTDGLGKAGELVRARVLFESTLAFDRREESRAPRARALAGLIGSYGKFGDFEEARHLSEILAACGDTEDMLELRAKAAVNLIVLHARTGNVAAAGELFEGLRTLGDSAAVSEAVAKASKFLEFFAANGRDKHGKAKRESSSAQAA
ncbi:MAG: hypothetical protein LBI92_10655 [Azoarcus sp.]|nr:hypothetical protein [Azoarcus sp.]